MDKEILQQTKQTICNKSESVSHVKSLKSTKNILGASPDEFFRLYNPTAGARLLSKNLSSGRVALLEKIPTLTEVISNYGHDTASKWIEIQILSLDTIQGATAYTPDAKQEATSLILSAYGDMTIAELLNFFARYKLGEYTEVTRYYGGLQKILIALRHYRTLRDADLIRLEREEEHQRAELERTERAGKCISYEEYQQSKKLRAI